MAHPSVNQNYDNLYSLNLQFSKFAQITKDNNRDDLVTLDRSVANYYSDGSLLFEALSDPVIETTDSPKIIKYRIIFEAANNRRLNRTYINSFAEISELDFSKEFFIRLPTELKPSSTCLDDKYCNQVADKTYWCKKCRGPFNSTAQFLQLMHPSIQIGNISKSCIIFIEKIVQSTKIDDIFSLDLENSDEAMLAGLKKCMEKEKNRILSLEQNLAQFSDRIKKCVEEEMAKNAQTRKTIDNLLLDYGGTMDGFQAHLNKIDVIISKRKLNKLLDEKKEIEKQRSELEHKISALHEEISTDGIDVGNICQDPAKIIKAKQVAMKEAEIAKLKLNLYAVLEKCIEIDRAQQDLSGK